MADKNITQNLLISPRYKLLRHLLLIAFIATISLQIIYTEFSGNYRIYAGTIFLTGFLSMIYFNMYVLVPVFLFKKKIISFIFLAFTSMLLMISVLICLQQFNPNAEEANALAMPASLMFLNLSSSLISLGLVIAGSTTGILFKRGVMYGQLIGELETATMKSELEQLKNQISPHFLFNMLNNANVLTKENPEEAARVLFKLNDLLKYQLNNSMQDQVLLSDDIKSLNDLLNLEKIRRDNFEFTVYEEGSTKHLSVPPLLFTPFVENAIKHNNDNKNLSYVYVLFKVDGNKLHFSCINSKPDRCKTRPEVGGLGLTNIKRRLELLYRNDYSLEIKDNDDKFIVSLMLNLK